MACTQLDSSPPAAVAPFGAAGGGSTGGLTPYDAPTYFPPSYFYGSGGGDGSAAPTGGLTPYDAPTYFAPSYFYGNAPAAVVVTPTPTSGRTPYDAPTYFAPSYFYGGGESPTTSPTGGLTPYDAPTYFAPSYFYGGPAAPPAITAVPKVIPGRDGGAYAALIAAIGATGAFEAVVFGDPTRQAGAGADAHPLAVVTPRGWEEADDVDPALYVRRVSFAVRVVIRVEEDADPFDRLDRLAAAVQARLDRSDLGGRCVGPLTKIRAGRYQPSSRYPEWSVDLDGEFSVLIDPAADLATA